MYVARIFGFPNRVNELAARCVAGGVALLTVTTIVLGAAVGHAWLWIAAALAYGFVARVLTGPRLSPLGQLATRVLAPRLGAPRLVAGPPKRFAQAMGATMTLAAVAVLAAGVYPAVFALLALLLAAATLESVFGFCIGCAIFGRLMRLGLVPEETCEACADISLRYSPAA
jgi:hypothetical protein